MNKRIQKLAEQALFESDFDDEQNIKITMEVFAELLVNEICKIVQLDGEILLPMIIKEHFGIE